MGCKVSYDDRENIIELALTGAVSEADLNEAAKVWTRMTRDHGCGVLLVDASTQEEAPSMMELYERPKLYAAELDRSFRVVFVMSHSPQVREAAIFWGTVCRNRGWSVHMFEKREEAMEWLKAVNSSD